MAATVGSQAPRYRVGVDIGGTFTDICAVDSQTGAWFGLKTPTTPDDLVTGVVNGLTLLEGQGVHPADIEHFAHGTTAAVNAIIQRSGARIALLVTEGDHDLLEIARLRLPVPWNFHSQRAQPLVPRERVIPVRARMRYTGQSEVDLTDTEVARVVDVVLGLGVEGVAICLLHSYANGAHEHRLEQALRQMAPGLAVSSSSDIWPQRREYERATATVLNVYVQPLMTRYFDTLDAGLEQAGMRARAYISRSNGGVMSVARAREVPVQTLLSGPASGVVGAASAAAEAGCSNVVTLDIGGTSADVAVLEEGTIQYARESRVGDFPLILPSVGVASIGAGGGSIGWIDSGRAVRVGPKSAGASPGPACYGQGGLEPTLTDAFVVCGLLNPRGFAGRRELDIVAALDALGALGAQLGLSAQNAADAMIRVALATMYTEMSAVFEQKGFDPRDFTLVAFGGAGPLLGCLVASDVRMRRVLIPPSPGTLCALGALQESVSSDFIATVDRRADAWSDRALSNTLLELRERASAWLDAEVPAQGGDRVVRLSADVRYAGQSYELEVPIADMAIAVDGLLQHIFSAFHALHARVYTHADPEATVEVVNLRARATASLPSALGQVMYPSGGNGAAAPGQRDLLLGGEWVASRVVHRANLRVGDRVDGPALIEQPDSTCLVPSGWSARVDERQSLIIVAE
jgi:N-methylhydantoinase A